MLDVSLQAGVLVLPARLPTERGPGLPRYHHDLRTTWVGTEELLVPNQGRVVEQGPTKDVLQHPTEEYTVRLLDAVVALLATASAG